MNYIPTAGGSSNTVVSDDDDKKKSTDQEQMHHVPHGKRAASIPLCLFRPLLLLFSFLSI
jgi:hypothetical protein